MTKDFQEEALHMQSSLDQVTSTSVKNGSVHIMETQQKTRMKHVQKFYIEVFALR